MVLLYPIGDGFQLANVLQCTPPRRELLNVSRRLTIFLGGDPGRITNIKLPLCRNRGSFSYSSCLMSSKKYRVLIYYIDMFRMLFNRYPLGIVHIPAIPDRECFVSQPIFFEPDCGRHNNTGSERRCHIISWSQCSIVFLQ